MSADEMTTARDWFTHLRESEERLWLRVIVAGETMDKSWRQQMPTLQMSGQSTRSRPGTRQWRPLAMSATMDIIRELRDGFTGR